MRHFRLDCSDIAFSVKVLLRDDLRCGKAFPGRSLGFAGSSSACSACRVPTVRPTAGHDSQRASSLTGLWTAQGQEVRMFIAPVLAQSRARGWGAQTPAGFSLSAEAFHRLVGHRHVDILPGPK